MTKEDLEPEKAKAQIESIHNEAGLKAKELVLNYLAENLPIMPKFFARIDGKWQDTEGIYVFNKTSKFAQEIMDETTGNERWKMVLLKNGIFMAPNYGDSKYLDLDKRIAIRPSDYFEYGHLAIKSVRYVKDYLSV